MATSDSYCPELLSTGNATQQLPGAGKTLVGLNVATRHSRKNDTAHAVFLSGDGPLVAVLRDALAHAEYDRIGLTGSAIRKGMSCSLPLFSHFEPLGPRLSAFRLCFSRPPETKLGLILTRLALPEELGASPSALLAGKALTWLS